MSDNEWFSMLPMNVAWNLRHRWNVHEEVAEAIGLRLEGGARAKAEVERLKERIEYLKQFVPPEVAEVRLSEPVNHRSEWD